MKQLIQTAQFPELPGVYVVYENAHDEQPLYVGMAGTQTLRKRWQVNHLYARAGGSSLRRSLGLHLGLAKEKLERPERYYAPEIEAQITAFLASCWIEFEPTETAAEAQDLEARTIDRLGPLLNAARPATRES